MLLLGLSAPSARAHDPGAWGGLFRTRDYGATWVSANRGQFLGGAIALAVSPADTNHLLLGADSGLFRSRNGGRDWTIEAPSLLLGSVFATTFAADGQRALISTSVGLFRGEADNAWREAPTPANAAPARALVRGSQAGRVYLAGWSGLYRSDDWGASWSNAATGLPLEAATALLVAPGAGETLYALVKGEIWASTDGARSWTRLVTGNVPVDVEALSVDPLQPARLWAASRQGVFRSDVGGAAWQLVGRPLPEPDTKVNGLAVSDEAIVAATDRGVYRSIDGGASWTPMTSGLPAHLEAGPLVRDPLDPASLYAGFALIPYPEIWRRAAAHAGAPTPSSVTGLAAGLGLLLLMTLLAILALRRLQPYYPPSHRSARAAGSRRISRKALL